MAESWCVRAEGSSDEVEEEEEASWEMREGANCGGVSSFLMYRERKDEPGPTFPVPAAE